MTKRLLIILIQQEQPILRLRQQLPIHAFIRFRPRRRQHVGVLAREIRHDFYDAGALQDLLGRLVGSRAGLVKEDVTVARLVRWFGPGWSGGDPGVPVWGVEDGEVGVLDGDGDEHVDEELGFELVAE